MRQIQLSNSRKLLVVDDEDFMRVNNWTWFITVDRRQIQARIMGRTVNIGRYVLGIKDGKIIVDHVDRNILNNCKSNLRQCTLQENNFNRKKENGTSKFHGVQFLDDKSRRKPWRAKVCKDGVVLFREAFLTEEEAARAYDKAAKEHFGEFAVLNF